MAVVAVDVLGLSYREAAHALGVREATITTRLFRARKQVAGQLAPPSARRGAEPNAAPDAPEPRLAAARAPLRQRERMRRRRSPSRWRDPMSDRYPSDEAELVEFVRSIDVKAPESLHREVAGDGRGLERAPAPSAVRRGDSASRRGSRARAALAAAVAALAIALLGRRRLLANPQPGAGRRGERCGRRRRRRRARARAPQAQLAAAVEGVAFPYWEGDFGWRSVGSRTRPRRRADGPDRLLHRPAAIESATRSSPAPRRRGLDRGRRSGAEARPTACSSQNGVPVVTWLRDGHMCVVSGRGVSSATLLRAGELGRAARQSPRARRRPARGGERLAVAAGRTRAAAGPAATSTRKERCA